MCALRAALVALALAGCSEAMTAPLDAGAPFDAATLLVAAPVLRTTSVAVAPPTCDETVFSRPPDVATHGGAWADCDRPVFSVDVPFLGLDTPFPSPLPTCWRVTSAPPESGWSIGTTFFSPHGEATVLLPGLDPHLVTFEARAFAPDGTSYGGSVTPAWAPVGTTLDVDGRVVALAGLPLPTEPSGRTNCSNRRALRQRATRLGVGVTGGGSHHRPRAQA